MQTYQHRLTRSRSVLLYAMLLSLGSLAVSTTAACAGGPETNSEVLARPSIQVLALSRGRGVPEAASKTMQVIEDKAKSAIAAGTVISISRRVFGLEGETQLCIVFRDHSALAAVGAEFHRLAKAVDLLQVTENACPNQADGQ